MTEPERREIESYLSQNRTRYTDAALETVNRNGIVSRLFALLDHDGIRAWLRRNTDRDYMQDMAARCAAVRDKNAAGHS